MERKQPWQDRWQGGVTPWDLGAAHPLTPRLLSAAEEAGALKPGGRILVPGCGSGHEAAFCAQNSYEALGMDFVPEAVEVACKKYADLEGLSFLQGDALDFYPGELFDAVLDRAMLCALQIKNRKTYLECMVNNLKPRGLFMGILFHEVQTEDGNGPPFGLSYDELMELFMDSFTLLSWETHDSHASKPDVIKSEFLCIWQKK